MKFRRGLSFLVVLLQSQASIAGPAIPLVRVADAQFTSSINDVLMTSGATVEGVVDGPLQSPIAAAAVTIAGIDPDDRGICVAIRQVTGSYRADFVVPNPGRGRVVRFLIPARKFVGVGRPMAEFAILARAVATRGCSKAAPILPASWSSEAPTGDLHALINDQQAFRVRAMVPPPPHDCLDLAGILPPGTALRKYRSACTVKPPSLCRSAYRFVVRLEEDGEFEDLPGLIRSIC